MNVPPGSLWRVVAADWLPGSSGPEFNGVWTTAEKRPPKYFHHNNTGEHYLPAGTLVLVGETELRSPRAKVQEFVRILWPIAGWVSRMYFNGPRYRMERVDGTTTTTAEEE